MTTILGPLPHFSALYFYNYRKIFLSFIMDLIKCCMDL